jgi:hypothetical protein
MNKFEAIEFIVKSDFEYVTHDDEWVEAGLYGLIEGIIKRKKDTYIKEELIKMMEEI